MQLSVKTLEQINNAFWEFSRENFESLSKKPPKILKVLYQVLKIKQQTKFEQIKYAMQVYSMEEIQGNIREAMEKAVKMSSFTDNPERVLGSWMKSVCEYQRSKQEIEKHKTTIFEIKKGICKTMKEVSHLKKLQEKYEAKHKDIRKYLEMNSNNFDCSTNSNVLLETVKRDSHYRQNCKSLDTHHTAPSFSITHQDLFYKENHEAHAQDNTSILYLENSAELGMHSLNFFCCK